MIAEVFFALALSLLSGADAALLYDTLKLGKQADQYERIWGRLMSISLIASALMTSTAEFLYRIHMRLPFILGTVSIAFFLVGALMLTEPPRQRIPARGVYFKGLWHTVKPYIVVRILYPLKRTTVLPIVNLNNKYGRFQTKSASPKIAISG
jgi:hypothetical protein